MKLREWRIQKVLTQKELAERAGVAEITVAAIERGVQLPSPRTSRKLAEALGIEPTQIEEVQQAIERQLSKKDLARIG
jgi:transcriptional regulator with XRE-family HTH domain